MARKEKRGIAMLRFSALAAVAFVLCSVSPALALGSSGTTSDSSENHRPPELTPEAAAPSDYAMAVRFIRHKQYTEAISHLESALADKPHDADILNYLGLAKRMIGDYDSSTYYSERALAFDANHKGAHENLGETDLAKNDSASAQKELAMLVTLCPSGCDERAALTKAIADYKPSASPGAAALPTATSPATTSSTSSGQL